jgi:hypothetical protein
VAGHLQARTCDGASKYLLAERSTEVSRLPR